MFNIFKKKSTKEDIPSQQENTSHEESKNEVKSEPNYIDKEVETPYIDIDEFTGAKTVGSEFIGIIKKDDDILEGLLLINLSNREGKDYLTLGYKEKG